MKVILLKDVKNLGKANEVVNVADGYAKNYLIRNKLAVIDTPSAQAQLKKLLEQQAKDEAKNIANAKKLKEQLENINLTFTLKAHDGNAFGEISAKSIITELADKHHIKIDKYMFDKNFENLKLGRHLVFIDVYKDIVAQLVVTVNEEN